MFSLPVISPVFRIVMRIVSIVVWSLTIVSAFGGGVNPEYLTIPAILCLALPYLAILSVLLTIFWVVNKRFIFTALGVLTIIACWSPLSMAFPLSTSKKAAEGEQTFKIMSWNVFCTPMISANPTIPETGLWNI